MKRVLNVGCGKDTYGTDFIDIYPERPGVIKCNIDEEMLPYPDETFDEVYCRCVFEHLTNLGRALKEMVRVLKKGGRLVLITDNANYWWYSVEGTVHLGSYEKDERSRDRHYALFTDWHLKNHLRKAGLKVVNIEYEMEDRYYFRPKAIVKDLINKILSKTPLWRLAYYRIKIIGIKN